MLLIQVIQEDIPKLLNQETMVDTLQQKLIIQVEALQLSQEVNIQVDKPNMFQVVRPNMFQEDQVHTMFQEDQAHTMFQVDQDIM